MLTSNIQAHIAVITTPFSSEPLLLQVRSCLHYLGFVCHHLPQYITQRDHVL